MTNNFLLYNTNIVEGVKTFWQKEPTFKSLQRKQESLRRPRPHPWCVFGSGALTIVLEWPFLNCHDYSAAVFPSVTTADAWRRWPHLSHAQRCRSKAKVPLRIYVKEQMGKLVQDALVKKGNKRGSNGWTDSRPAWMIQLPYNTTDFHSLFEALTSWRIVLNQNSCKLLGLLNWNFPSAAQTLLYFCSFL